MKNILLKDNNKFRLSEQVFWFFNKFPSETQWMLTDVSFDQSNHINLWIILTRSNIGHVINDQFLILFLLYSSEKGQMTVKNECALMIFFTYKIIWKSSILGASLFRQSCLNLYYLALKISKIVQNRHLLLENIMKSVWQQCSGLSLSSHLDDFILWQAWISKKNRVKSAISGCWRA